MLPLSKAEDRKREQKYQKVNKLSKWRLPTAPKLNYSHTE